MMENMSRFHIRPARPDEAGLFYTPNPEEDKRRGTIGHVRMDFGRSGNEFWHTWWPRGPEELNSPVFKHAAGECAEKPLRYGAFLLCPRWQNQRWLDTKLRLHRGNGALPLLPAL